MVRSVDAVLLLYAVGGNVAVACDSVAMDMTLPVLKDVVASANDRPVDDAHGKAAGSVPAAGDETAPPPVSFPLVSSTCV